MWQDRFDHWRVSGETNRLYSYHDEKAGERQELSGLHSRWIEGGGRLLIDPEALLPDLLQHFLSGSAIIVAGAEAVFASDRWGPIDLARLLQGAEAYPTNIGQAELFRDLAIVLNRHRLGISNSKKHWGQRAKGIYRDNDWNNIFVSWQNFLWLHHRLDWSGYGGETGYDKFATEKFQGDSQKAWKVAASLLSKDEFAQLGWGKQKQTNVKEQEAIRTTLRAGLADGYLREETGYDKFATEKFQGDSQKAWTVAASLLSKDEFAQLGWGKQKQTNVKEQEAIRTTLRAGLADGSLREETGYDKFATEKFQGDSQKAWTVAASLLSKDEFAQLEWKKAKFTNVKEQEAIRTTLRAGLSDGSLREETGYDKFATEKFQGDSHKAWTVAASLLTKDEFAQLEWGGQKRGRTEKQEFKELEFETEFETDEFEAYSPL